MAEVLGVVASTIQIADSAVKLRQLWMGIRDMPETVRDLVEDVNLLASTLAQIQNVPLPNTVIQQNNTAWKDCLQALQTVSTSFQSFVNDLDNHMSTHKKTGPIKAFLKKEKILECKQRLERLKTTMLLAQQSYNQVVFCQQYTTIIDTLQVIQRHQSMLPSPNQLVVGSPSLTGASDSAVDTIARVSQLSSANQPPLSRSSKRNRTQFDLRLPGWIYKKALKVLINRSYGAWTLNLRVYNRVDGNSLVFTAARFGDWRTVQNLFNRGEASPFDINEDGQNLLHLAATWHDTHGCRLLLSLGADMDLRDILDATPLADFVLGFSHSPQPFDTELVHLLAPWFENRILLSDMDERYGRVHFLPKKAMQTLITYMSSTYQVIEPLHRATRLFNFFGHDPEGILLMLGPDLCLPTALSLLRDNDCHDFFGHNVNHREMLCQIAWHFAIVIDNEDAVQAFTEAWKPIIAEVIVCERQTDLRLTFDSCIMELFDCLGPYLLATYSEFHEHVSIWLPKLTTITRAWVKLLLAAGLDLERYGNAERRSLLHTKHFGFQVYEGGDTGIYYARVNGLLTGPSVEDWVVYAVPYGTFDCHSAQWVNVEYEMAGEFWKNIEEPELFGVPGAFLDEHSDSDWNVYSRRSVYVTAPIF